MTDFVVYISAQQQMQAVMSDIDDTDATRPVRKRVVTLSGIHGFRKRISVTLFRLAEAIQPIGEPATGLGNAPR